MTANRRAFLGAAAAAIAGLGGCLDATTRRSSDSRPEETVPRTPSTYPDTVPHDVVFESAMEDPLEVTVILLSTEVDAAVDAATRVVRQGERTEPVTFDVALGREYRLKVLVEGETVEELAYVPENHHTAAVRIDSDGSVEVRIRPS